jgi:hypothetical protein
MQKKKKKVHTGHKDNEFSWEEKGKNMKDIERNGIHRCKY